MEIHPQILTFGVSLIAILALSGLAYVLRLGGAPVLANDADARRVAGEIADGFEAVEIAIGSAGTGAILLGEAGEIMVIKRHGNQFAGRILTDISSAAACEDQITITTGEARFGTVSITHPDSASWAEAINRLHGSSNA
ncbi:hypothetical protein FGU71_06270 [Erythrobacter insulae]|uniref:Uncharacterized protein n=1 Tax=Erythrobacter insulae TaxID=2584124 RepID=A0A547PBI0_9SPHN|nr:hypothetical protein [Erythrobacter insulae]TRD11500.1 hypothetical protein FGU71_06270 [Erythrobacter insulae]